MLNVGWHVGSPSQSQAEALALDPNINLPRIMIPGDHLLRTQGEHQHNPSQCCRFTLFGGRAAYDDVG
jgi:hypothetical protein